jgi:hypothetical protein
LADGYRLSQIFGGRPLPVTAFGRDRSRVPSTRGVHVAGCGGPLGPIVIAADRPLGNSVGAIEWPLGCFLRPVAGSAWAGHAYASPFLVAQLRLFSEAFARCSCRSLARIQDSYLVDSASSHMLVSKIKPCMSKYKHLYRETANGSLNQLSFI